MCACFKKQSKPAVKTHILHLRNVKLSLGNRKMS
jgi:hypothetical protein